MSRGQLTIIGIFGLSLVAVAGSLVWRYRETRQVLDFWGAEAATLIARAEQVEALKLEPIADAPLPSDRPARQLKIDGQVYFVAQVKDVSDAPGFTHARHALHLNRSFEWDGVNDCTPNWTYALQFGQGDKSAVVLIDPHCRFVRLLDGEKLAVLNPTVADGLAIVLNEQFAGRETSAESTTNSLENREGAPQ